MLVIDSTYTAIHVDVRISNYWKGNEIVTTAYSVTDDFYKYYSLKNSDIYPATTKKTVEISMTVDGKIYSGILTEK